MFCDQCGTELPATANFCASCGAQIVAPARTVAPPPRASDEETSDAPPLGRQRKLATKPRVAAVALLIAVAVGTLIVLNNQHSTRNPLHVSTPAQLAQALRDRGVPCARDEESSSADPPSGACTDDAVSLVFRISSDIGYERSALSSACSTSSDFKVVYVNGPGWSIAVVDVTAFLQAPQGQIPADPNNVEQDAAATIASATGGSTRIFTSSDCPGTT